MKSEPVSCQRKDLLGSETSAGRGPVAPTAGEQPAGLRNREESGGAGERGGGAAGERGHEAGAR